METATHFDARRDEKKHIRYELTWVMDMHVVPVGVEILVGWGDDAEQQDLPADAEMVDEPSKTAAQTLIAHPTPRTRR